MKRLAKVRIIYEIVEEMARKYIALVMLSAGFFILGLGTKDLDDAQARKILAQQMTDQRRDLAASCDARIVQNDKLMTDRLAERDSLMRDQVARISDQATQLENQGNLIAIIAGRQVENTERNRKAMAALQSTLKQTKDAAGVAARTATDARAAAEVAAHTAEVQEHAQINRAVSRPASATQAKEKSR
jgi:hypothetical protein